ncbi:MAG TPA: hypothetical protein VK025_05040 [Steroidobacter sp.]|jgi:hypothetical protein|nr:hypothetical protein [Steroidobacteraceae bacterium]HLS80747.1 hypothetical protein [Steroidobacter sp.]
MDPENNIVDDEPEEIGQADTAETGEDTPVEQTPEQQDADMLAAVSAAIDEQTVKPKSEETPAEGDDAPGAETQERDEHGRFKAKAKPAEGEPHCDGHGGAAYAGWCAARRATRPQASCHV